MKALFRNHETLQLEQDTEHLGRKLNVESEERTFTKGHLKEAEVSKSKSHTLLGDPIMGHLAVTAVFIAHLSGFQITMETLFWVMPEKVLPEPANQGWKSHLTAGDTCCEMRGGEWHLSLYSQPPGLPALPPDCRHSVTGSLLAALASFPMLRAVF